MCGHDVAGIGPDYRGYVCVVVVFSHDPVPANFDAAGLGSQIDLDPVARVIVVTRSDFAEPLEGRLISRCGRANQGLDKLRRGIFGTRQLVGGEEDDCECQGKSPLCRPVAAT